MIFRNRLPDFLLSYFSIEGLLLLLLVDPPAKISSLFVAEAIDFNLFYLERLILSFLEPLSIELKPRLSFGWKNLSAYVHANPIPDLAFYLLNSALREVNIMNLVLSSIFFAFIIRLILSYYFIVNSTWLSKSRIESIPSSVF